MERVPLFFLLDRVGTLPQARYVIYRSMQSGWWESIDMADALHPQTLVTDGMNGAALPVKFGGPLRLRVPRQLGYKSVKYITGLTLTESLQGFGFGLSRSGLRLVRQHLKETGSRAGANSRERRFVRLGPA